MIMRTKRTDSAIRVKLMEAAQRLMLAKGFSATSVDEICEAAEVTKGSFFHYFKSKEDLGKAVLDHFMSSMSQVVLGSPFFKKSDPLQRIYGYIDFMIDVSRDPERRSGCLLGNFAQVLSDTHPDIRSLCAKHFSWWADTLIHELDEAKKRHAIKRSVDTRVLAEHFIALFEGSLMLAKTRQDIGIIERNLRNYKQYLKNIFGK
jgi:TetR/AcrR family transcriptional repressor of nem operon